MRTTAVLIASVMTVAAAGTASGQTNQAAGRDLCGGWSAAPTNDAGVRAAAESAVSARAAAAGVKLTLSAVLEARRQVVAGLNYRLLLAVASNGVPATAAATVWRKPGGSYSPTDWSWTGGQPSKEPPVKDGSRMPGK